MLDLPDASVTSGAPQPPEPAWSLRGVPAAARPNYLAILYLGPQK